MSVIKKDQINQIQIFRAPAPSQSSPMLNKLLACRVFLSLGVTHISCLTYASKHQSEQDQVLQAVLNQQVKKLLTVQKNSFNLLMRKLGIIEPKDKICSHLLE